MSLDKLKKGDKVILHMFTGIAVNCTEIVACDTKTITIKKKDGSKVKFSRKTGRQIDPKAKSEKFANFITEDDGSYDPENRTTPKSGKKKPAKKSEPKKVTKKGKKPEPEEEPDEGDYEEPEEEEDDIEEEPEEKPVKKAAKKPSKKPAKKPAKKTPKEEDDEGDEEYEED